VGEGTHGVVDVEFFLQWPFVVTDFFYNVIIFFFYVCLRFVFLSLMSLD
jgi:hypothetical protein